MFIKCKTNMKYQKPAKKEVLYFTNTPNLVHLKMGFYSQKVHAYTHLNAFSRTSN